MKSWRHARMVALVLVAIVALSGCTASTSAMKTNLIELELAELSGALNALPYVGIVSTFYNEDAEYEQQARVVVSANTPTAEQAIVIATTANAALSSDVLASVTRSFELKNVGTTLFRQADFGLTLDQLSAEIRYTFALQEAFGAPLTVGVDAAWEEADPRDYQRWIDGSGSFPQPGDWDALRSVDDPNPSSVGASWYFDGVSIAGPLPPAEITDLIHLLVAALPKFDGEMSVGSSWMSWDSYQQRLDVFVDAFSMPGATSTQPLTSTDLWPRVVDAAAHIADSEISKVTFTVSSTVNDEYQGATLHFGSCAIAESAQARDIALAEALASSGIVFPLDSGPANCTQF